MSAWGGFFGNGCEFLPHRETVRHRVNVDQRTSVVEQRAPTDESVRLLREMEQAASDKFKDGIRLEGNDFNAVVAVHQIDWTGDTGAVCLFDFNGERMEVTATVTRFEVSQNQFALVFKLRDEVAKVIAGRCLERAFLPVMSFFK